MSLLYFSKLIDFGCTSLCIWESFEDFQKGEEGYTYINGLVPLKAYMEQHDGGIGDIQYIGVSIDIMDCIDIVVR